MTAGATVNGGGGSNSSLSDAIKLLPMDRAELDRHSGAMRAAHGGAFSGAPPHGPPNQPVPDAYGAMIQGGVRADRTAFTKQQQTPGGLLAGSDQLREGTTKQLSAREVGQPPQLHPSAQKGNLGHGLSRSSAVAIGPGGLPSLADSRGLGLPGTGAQLAASKDSSDNVAPVPAVASGEPLDAEEPSADGELSLGGMVADMDAFLDSIHNS